MGNDNMNKFEQGSGFSEETNDIKGGLGEEGKEQPVITVNELVYNAEQLSENSSKMIEQDLLDQARQADPSGEVTKQKEILRADARRQNHTGLYTSLAGKAIVAFAALAYISSACKTPVLAEFSTETPPISRVSEGVPIASEEAEEGDGVQETAQSLMEETREGKKEDIFEPIEQPEAEQQIPDVDLGWDWEDFEGYFRMTPTAEQMEESFKPEQNKSKYVVFGENAVRMYEFNRTYPSTSEDLENSDTIRKLNETLKLGLDEQGEEVLRQMFLYQLEDGKEIEDQDVFVYIYVKEGWPYEKDGPLTIIWQDGTPQVFAEEDIPWDKIPSDIWDDIVAGNTKVDMSGGEVVCSRNVNDIGLSSNSAE